MNLKVNDRVTLNVPYLKGEYGTVTKILYTQKYPNGYIEVTADYTKNGNTIDGAFPVFEKDVTPFSRCNNCNTQIPTESTT